jgi:hypothetical protein
MSQADELEALVQYIAVVVDINSYLDRKLRRLDEIASVGGFLHPDTSECIMLRVAAADLRKMADRIDIRRQLLEGNARERLAL